MQVSDYSIYDDDKELHVKLCKNDDTVSLDSHELELLKESHAALFNDVLKIRTSWLKCTFGEAEKNYLVVPLYFIPFHQPMVAYIGFDLAQQLASMRSSGGAVKSGTYLKPITWPTSLDRFRNAIVTRKYDDTVCTLHEVKDVSSDINLSSPFPQGDGSTYKDYFTKKYECTFTDDTQPALICKPLARAGTRLQLLLSRYKTHEGADVKKGEHRRRTIELFPEICNLYPLSASLWKLANCVPSILWRVECILTVDTLRARISTETGIGKLPDGSELTTCIDFRGYRDMGFGNLATQCLLTNQLGEVEVVTDNSRDPLEPPLRGSGNVLLLQALTTKSANDSVDLERLESLGDSFLKFSTTVFLYADRTTAHEGKLSLARSRRVSNLNLFRLAKHQGVTDVIFSSAFNPQQMWIPPCFEFDEKDPTLTYHPAPPPPEGVQECDNQAAPPEQENLKHLLSVEEKHYLYHKLTDKGVADCVESLIGAYLVSGGILAGLKFMTWMGVKIQRSEVEEMEGVEALGSSDLKKGTPPPSFESYASAPRPKQMKMDRSRTPIFIQKSASILTQFFSFHLYPRHQLDRKQETELNRLLTMSSGKEDIQKTLHWKFRDRTLLLQAITHASYSRNRVTECYQRLEFLGDAVLDYLVTCYIYSTFPDYGPGEISSMRSALVNNHTFAELAVVDLKLHAVLLHNSPSLYKQIECYVKAVGEHSREEKQFDKGVVYRVETEDQVRKGLYQNICSTCISK